MLAFLSSLSAPYACYHIQGDVMQVYAAPVCFIFDVVAISSFTRETVVSGLKEVLESNSIIKVMHDCSKPAAAIFYQLHIRLCNVFDTQVAMG